MMNVDQSHNTLPSFSHTHTHTTLNTRRPSTSPGIRSTGNNITFLFDSPPIPGDDDYTGEDLAPSTSISTEQGQVTRDRAAPSSISRTPSESRLQALPQIHYPVLGGYSVSTSARTSYTRVDLTAEMERDETESSSRAGDVGEEQRADRREEEGGHVEDEQAQQNTTSPTPIPQTPQVSLCFLLISGKRRVMSFDPETTVGRVKELVWNAWPSDWQDEQPPTPWHLRVLHLGKILQDDDTLKGLSFAVHTPTPEIPSPTPTIVHLSVRPFGPGAPTPDDALKKKRKSIRLGRWGSTNDASEAAITAPTDNAGSNGGNRPGEDREASCCGCIIC